MSSAPPNPFQTEIMGWRIPFVIGAMLAIFTVVMRRTMHETDVFVASQKSGEANPLDP